MKIQRGNGIIAQVAVLFAIGVLATGVLTFFTQQVLSINSVTRQAEDFASNISNEVVLAVKEYPAYDWLLEYWYENADEMDIEYDAAFDADTETASKYLAFNNRHPEFAIKYATAEDLEALPGEDQKLYAEITYSWLITRIDQIKQNYGVYFLYCVITDSEYSKQFFLFSAADQDSVRGTTYGEVYTIGNTVSVIGNTGLQDAMRYAIENENYLTTSGDFLDYYTYLDDVKGEPALIGVSFDHSKLLDDVNKAAYKETLTVMISQFILAIICLFLLLTYIIHPLKKIQQNIRLYTETKDSPIVIKNLSELRLSNEMGQLSDDIVSLVKEIDDYLDEIGTITSEKERISAELNLASRIQLDMLPNMFPPYPERSDLNIYGTMTPAKEVGGDFFDFFLVDDDHLAMVIADVSGKGIPASLFMMTTKIMIENAITASNMQHPNEVLEVVNEQICKHNREEMFVTVWLGILDLKTSVVTAANAGHEYPIIKSPTGSFEVMHDTHGFVLGGMEGMKYKDYTFRMEPGSKLFLYTDGVPEATNLKAEMFGLERTVQTLRSVENETPAMILKAVNEAVDDFVGEAIQFDDTTMLCVHHIGSER